MGWHSDLRQGSESAFFCRMGFDLPPPHPTGMSQGCSLLAPRRNAEISDSEACVNTSGSTSILGPAGWQLPAMSYFCSLSPCFGVLWVLLVPPCAVWERWWNSQHSSSSLAGLQRWRGKGRICFQCAASIRVWEVQWGTWTRICTVLTVLFPWWKGSTPGDV